MVSIKNLNNYSDELKKTIQPLDNGQEVVFQMLNGHPNNDPDVESRRINPMLFGKTQIPTYFQIKDPYSKELVHVGMPQSIKDDQVTSFVPFLAGEFDGIFSGKFSLFGGNVRDEQLYKVFWLHPQRQDSPCQDKSQPALFKILSAKEENNKTLTKVDTLRKSLEVLKALSQDEINEIAASQNWAGDNESMKAKVSELAKSDPETFLKVQKDENTKVRANLKKAIDKGFLKVDAVTRKVMVNDSELLTIGKDNMVDQLGAISKWIASARNGKEIYEGILKQLG